MEEVEKPEVGCEDKFKKFNGEEALAGEETIWEGILEGEDEGCEEEFKKFEEKQVAGEKIDSFIKASFLGKEEEGQDCLLGFKKLGFEEQLAQADGRGLEPTLVNPHGRRPKEKRLQNFEIWCSRRKLGLRSWTSSDEEVEAYDGREVEDGGGSRRRQREEEMDAEVTKVEPNRDLGFQIGANPVLGCANPELGLGFRRGIGIGAELGLGFARSQKTAILELEFRRPGLGFRERGEWRHDLGVQEGEGLRLGFGIWCDLGFNGGKQLQIFDPGGCFDLGGCFDQDWGELGFIEQWQIFDPGGELKPQSHVAKSYELLAQLNLVQGGLKKAKENIGLIE